MYDDRVWLIFWDQWLITMLEAMLEGGGGNNRGKVNNV